MLTQLAAYLGIHITCGILAYGMMQGHFHARYMVIPPIMREDMHERSMFTALAGPIGLMACILWTDWLNNKPRWKK